MLQTLELNLATRHLVNELLAGITKSDTTTARTVRTIRDRLELRAAKRQVITMTEEAQESRRALDWDDLLEYDGADFPLKKFSLDDAHIKFLQEELLARDWNEVKRGEGKTERAPLPAGMLDAIADLADALAGAKAHE